MRYIAAIIVALLPAVPAILVAAGWMTTFYHIQVGAIESREEQNE
jgi:hypothetical protein